MCANALINIGASEILLGELGSLLRKASQSEQVEAGISLIQQASQDILRFRWLRSSHKLASDPAIDYDDLKQEASLHLLQILRNPDFFSWAKLQQKNGRLLQELAYEGYKAARRALYQQAHKEYTEHPDTRVDALAVWEDLIGETDATDALMISQLRSEERAEEVLYNALGRHHGRVMCELFGINTDQKKSRVIAAELGITVDNLRQRVHRMRKVLRENVQWDT